MRKTKTLTLTMIFILSFFSLSHAEIKIRIVVEELPPFSYINNGQITGLNVDMIRAVFSESDIPYYIEVRKHEAILIETLNEKNTFTLVQGKNAENLRHLILIGPLCPVNYGLYSVKELKIRNIAQLNDYRAAVSASPQLEEYLFENGYVRKNTSADSVPQATDLDKLTGLTGGEIDILAISGPQLNFLAESNAINSKNIKLIFSITPESDMDYYLAANKLTDPGLINEITMSLEKIKQNGIYSDILQKWHDE